MADFNVFVRNGQDPLLKKVMARLHSLRYKNIRIWIERAVSNDLPYRNWKDKTFIEDNVGVMPNLYFEWDLANSSANHLDYSMRCLWWHWICENHDFCVMQNPLPIKKQIVLFKDVLNDQNFPDSFQKTICFNDYDGFINYCRSRGIVKFNLHDQNQFRHEHDFHLQKGAEVFRELATERLWYKDTFHKDHYEIFDPTGKRHIAEADMNGIVDPSKADPSKHPIK